MPAPQRGSKSCTCGVLHVGGVGGTDSRGFPAPGANPAHARCCAFLPERVVKLRPADRPARGQGNTSDPSWFPAEPDW